MSTGLEVVDLTKHFGHGKETITAVNNVSFDIKEGELFSLLGESGCGKTTTLRMIAGLEQVTEGTILFSGQNYTHLPPNKRGIGMVFQSYALYPHMSIFENVAYGLRIRKNTNREIKHKVEEVLEVVDLPAEIYSNRRPSELSGGQQQRIALARALVYNPKLLLFDEPLSNLDAKLRVNMREEIRKVHRRLGITAVYVTHDQEEALAISDRIAVMFNGSIEQIGTPLEVYEKPSTVNIADFIGKANLVPAKLIKKNGSVGIAEFQSGEKIEGLIEINPDQLGKHISVMIRPERMELLVPETNRGYDQINSIKARVTNQIYLGSRTRYQLETSFGTKLTCDSIRRIAKVEPGSEVCLRIKPDDALFLPKKVLPLNDDAISKKIPDAISPELS